MLGDGEAYGKVTREEALKFLTNLRGVAKNGMLIEPFESMIRGYKPRDSTYATQSSNERTSNVPGIMQAIRNHNIGNEYNTARESPAKTVRSISARKIAAS